MANKYLDCTLPNIISLGDGTEINPYNLYWAWNNVDTGNSWYINGRVYGTPNQIQIKPLEMIMWDYYSPFILDGIQESDDLVSEVNIIRGGIGQFDVIGRANYVYASIIFGDGTANFHSGSNYKSFSGCTFYTSNGAPLALIFGDIAANCNMVFRSCIFNGAILSCTNASGWAYITNCASDEANIAAFTSAWANGKTDTENDYGVTPLPFITLASVIANPKTEKEKVRRSKLIGDGYTSSGLDSFDSSYDFGGIKDSGVYGFFGGRRYGRGAIWFDNAYYVDLSIPSSSGNASGDSVNRWGYLDFIEFMRGNIVSRQRIREADTFFLEGDYTWIAQLKFPSFRNLSMKLFENSPDSVDYIPITFKRRYDGVPTQINSPTDLVDFGTNNKFEFIILRQGTLGSDVRYNQFEDCIFFDSTEIKVPASFIGSTKGVVTFNRCTFITPRIYLKGEPTNDPADFSAHFYRCALYGYNTTKIQIKADSYSEVSPINISRVFHIGSATVFRNGPFIINGNIFTEAPVEWDGWCSGTVFNGGYWAAVDTDPTTDKEQFRGDYDFVGGFKTEVDTQWTITGGGDPDPASGEIHIRDSFGVTDTAHLIFDPGHSQLNVHCDTLHDPDTLDPNGIDQQDASTFYYNNTPFTGIANVTGLNAYNGGGAFDFSVIPASFSERPQQVVFDWNNPDVQNNYVNWTVVRTALGIPSWQKQLTVAQLESAYAYCVSNGNMIGQFALIRVNDLLVPKPSANPLEAFQSKILFVIDSHIHVQYLVPTGFWNCSPTSSINMIVRSGGQLTFGGPVYNDGLYRGMILAEPGSTITMGQSGVNLRKMSCAIYDYSGGTTTNWYSQEAGITIDYDIPLMDSLEDLGILTNIGGTEEVIKVTTIKVEECWFWPDSTGLNETPLDLTITEVLNNSNTALLQIPPTVYGSIDRDSMIFSDYNNSDNLKIGTEVVGTLGMWGSDRVDNSVGVWSSEAYPVPRDYYVDTTETTPGDGTELTPFTMKQYHDYMGSIASYSIVSGDRVFIYGPLQGLSDDPFNVRCADYTILEHHAWRRDGYPYHPALLDMPVGGASSIFTFIDAQEGLHFTFYDIGFIITTTQTPMFAEGMTKSTFDMYNCIVTSGSDIASSFDPGIERDEVVGTPIQNTINWYTSSFSVHNMFSVTGRVTWNDVAVNIYRADSVIVPEELSIDGAEINLSESDFTLTAPQKVNIEWDSVPASGMPFGRQVSGTSDLFTPDDYLWYFLGFTNNGKGASQWSSWNVNSGMENYIRRGVGYLSFKPSGRDLYTDFDKVSTGDGTQTNPWNRSQFLTYFGNAGNDVISTTSRRGDVLWCKGLCYVYDEGAFIPYNIDTKNITVRGWDINITHVILVDFSSSVAAEKSVVLVTPGKYLFELIIKDFFFFINNDDLGVIENTHAPVYEEPSALFYNSSFQTPLGQYLYLNRTQANDTMTRLIGSTIKSETIVTHGISNNIDIDNTSIDGVWQDDEIPA